MKTRAELVSALLAAGWSLAEIKSVLGFLPANGANKTQSDSPWWSWVEEEWYTVGTPNVREWAAWIERA